MKCLILIVMLSLLATISTVICQRPPRPPPRPPQPPPRPPQPPPPSPRPPPPSPPPPPPPPVAKAEAYLLVFQWPKTVCKLAPKNKPCQEPYASQMPQNFKVHGLWPTSRNYGPSIIDCRGPDFSYSALNSIKSSLIVYWPNLLQRQREFLEYQWNKHGKCSGYNQYDYFNKGLELSRAHSVDIKTALADANIRPGGGQILRGNIRTAIHKKFNVLCRIACKVDTSGARYLQEIRFCLDANFVLRDCPERNWFTTNCGADTDKLIFPVP